MKQSREKKLGHFRVLFSRTLHAYFLMRRGLTFGVRAIVQQNDGKYEFVRHTYMPGWHISGGGVEKRQTTDIALLDELR